MNLVNQKFKPKKLVYTGNVQKHNEDGTNIRVGSVRLYEVESDNEDAPVCSGELRVLDRIYRIALWSFKEKAD